MNKSKQLAKRLSVEFAIVLAVVAGAGAAMVVTGNLADSAVTKKTTAESALAQDTSQLSAARMQLDRSGEAEKRFVDIQLNHGSAEFSSKTDALKEWMRTAKTRYRLANNFKISLPPEAASTKPELSGLDYAISTRDGATLEFDAISDLHVYSFINDMMASTPGLIHLNSLDLERKDDMRPATVAQMMGGMTPNLVSARVNFNWVGINPKEAPANAAATPAMPGMGGAPTP